MDQELFRIFISRDLDHSSIFAKRLKQSIDDRKKEIEIIGQSCLSFSAISFELPSAFDALCFYSQNGVKFFLQNIPPNFSNKHKVPIIAFGKATANTLEKSGYPVTIVGNGNPKDLSIQILNQFKGRKILFPQAESSKNSLQPYLENDLEYIPIDVYKNSERIIPDLGGFDVLVFTSPRNVVAFNKTNSLTAKIVAIGVTTATQLLSLTDHPILMASNPYEEDLANAVIKALDL